jgi:hypothetical protein
MMSAVPDWKTNPLGQHEYAYREMMGSESTAWGAIKNSTSIRGATGAMAGFERPQGFSWKNPEGAHNFDGRLEAANTNLEKFAGTAETTGQTLESSVGGAAKGLDGLGGGMSKFGQMLASAQSSGNGGLFSALSSLTGIGQSIFNGSGQLQGAFSGGWTGVSGGGFGLYSVGGYTGAGNMNDPAGIVHRGEVVWSQMDVARAGGVDAVEGMRKGYRGYASGGSPGHQSSGGGGGNGIREITIAIDEDGSPFVKRMRDISREEAEPMIESNQRMNNRTFGDRFQKFDNNKRRRSYS